MNLTFAAVCCARTKFVRHPDNQFSFGSLLASVTVSITALLSAPVEAPATSERSISSFFDLNRLQRSGQKSPPPAHLQAMSVSEPRQLPGRRCGIHPGADRRARYHLRVVPRKASSVRAATSCSGVLTSRRGPSTIFSCNCCDNVRAGRAISLCPRRKRCGLCALHAPLSQASPPLLWRVGDRIIHMALIARLRPATPPSAI